MAFEHVYIDYGDGYYLPRMARQALDNFRKGRDGLRDIAGIANFMVDTAPNPDDYTEVEARFRLPAGTGATFVGEINSVLSKIDSDASQTNTLAAINQMLGKLG